MTKDLAINQNLHENNKIIDSLKTTVYGFVKSVLTLVLLNPDLSVFENTVNPDQLVSAEAI